MKNKTYKKILFIFIIILTFFSIIFGNNNVLAYEIKQNNYTFFIENRVYEKLKTFPEYNDDYNFYISRWEGLYDYYFMPKNVAQNVKFYTNGRSIRSTAKINNIKYYKLDLNFNIYRDETINWQFNDRYDLDDNTNTKYFYTDLNVYTDDTFTTIFFQGTPLMEVTIPAVETVEQIPEIMKMVMKIIIPIGLVILSIGLLIFLIRLIILRVM